MTGSPFVPFGQDRTGQRLIVEGVVPLDRKVLPDEVDGRFFIYEHRDVGRGGPPRHVHHAGDEWIYVLDGRITVEVGDQRYELTPGESVLGPREIPHSWANLTHQPASLIFLAQPAGTMQAFFKTLDGRKDIPWSELEDLYRRHAMTLLGPPLAE